MSRKLFLGVLCLCLLLVSCTAVPTQETSSVLVMADEEYSFKTQEEFHQYLISETEKNPQKVRMLERAEKEGLDPDTLKICLPIQLPEGFELVEINTSPTWHVVYFYYETERPVSLALQKQLEEIRKNPEPPVQLESRSRPESFIIIEESSESPSSSGEVQSNVLRESDIADAVLSSRTISFCWDFVSDGEALLKNDLDTGQYEGTGVSGYYYSNYGGLVYHIIWVENGYSFTVNFPVESPDVTVKEIIENNPDVFHIREELLSLKEG